MKRLRHILPSNSLVTIHNHLLGHIWITAMLYMTKPNNDWFSDNKEQFQYANIKHNYNQPQNI